MIVGEQLRNSRYGWHSDIYLIKIDSNLNLIWEKNYGEIPKKRDRDKDEEGYDIVQTADGYLIVGQSESYSDKRQTYIVKIDFDGNQQNYELYQAGYKSGALRVIKGNDGNFIVASNVYFKIPDPPYHYHLPWVIKVNSDGEEIWKRLYGSGHEDSKIAHDISPKFIDGGYYLAGPTSPTGVNQNGWMQRIDESGNEVGEIQTYGLPDVGDDILSIEQDEKGLRLAGSIYSVATKYDAYLATDSGDYAYVRNPVNRTLKDQTIPEDTRTKYYILEIEDAGDYAFISGMEQDLQAALFDDSWNIIDVNEGYKDIGDCTEGNQRSGNDQDNFMIRAELNPGTYILQVEPEDEETVIDGNFSLVMLKKPESSEDFFAGMDALLDDDDTSNDYLDIYVKALYVNYYPTVDYTDPVNFHGNCVYFQGVCAERQCKALTNFYLLEILNLNRMRTDEDIEYGWTIFEEDAQCVAQNDYLLSVDEGFLAFHGTNGPVCGGYQANDRYCYDFVNQVVIRGSACVTSNFLNQQGDIFARFITGGTHKGLIYGNGNILDANWSSPTDGRLRKASATDSSRNPETWKISRPQ